MRSLFIPQLNRNEKILLIDDEEAILSIMEQLLKRYDYEVESFAKSQDALACFESSPHDFDVVITDMTMPGITGDKLIAKIKAIRSEVPVILCTGFNEDIFDGQPHWSKPDKILMKPSGKDELLKNIRMLLDGQIQLNPGE